MEDKQKKIMTNEEIASSVASQWCRCYKCDGIIRDTGDKCNKDTMVTCHQWYHSYRAAELACGEKDRQFKEYFEKKGEIEMTNEEKVQELAISYTQYDSNEDVNIVDVFGALRNMAEWKDQQFKDIINSCLDYFERGKDSGFVSENSYNDMRYFASKIFDKLSEEEK